MTLDSGHIYFGGSFFPPHRAHTEMLTQALLRDRNAALHIVPTKQNPLKDSPGAPLELIQAWMDDLADELPFTSFSRVQLELSEFLSPHANNFTVDTLAGLKSLHQHWVLLLGSDAAATFARWKEPAHLLSELNEIWIVPRAQSQTTIDENALCEIFRKFDPEVSITFLNPVAEISSSELRDEAPSQKLAEHLSPRVLEAWKKFTRDGHSL